jgi:hypothetical protein
MGQPVRAVPLRGSVSRQQVTPGARRANSQSSELFLSGTAALLVAIGISHSDGSFEGLLPSGDTV